MTSSHRLGIQIEPDYVGAALIDHQTNRVVSSAAFPRDLQQEAFAQIIDSFSAGVPWDSILYISIVSTDVLDALARRDLATVGVLRICAPASISVSPMITWPRDLADLITGPIRVVSGGFDYGGQEVTALDKSAIYKFARDCRDTVSAIAISGLNSMANPDHEYRAALIVREVLGHDIPIALAHETGGGLGLIERENATILNAAVARSFNRSVRSRRNVLERRDITREVFLGQNDGTVVTEDAAARRPVSTIDSFMSHAMRGVRHTCEVNEAVVVYVGRSQIVFGRLTEGYPRLSPFPVEITSIRIQHHSPDLAAVTLQEPLTLGDHTLSEVDKQRCEEALLRFVVADVTLSLVAVGPFAPAVVEFAESWVGEVVVASHAGAAAAIGVAAADVAVTVDRSFDYDRSCRQRSLASTSEVARLSAVRAGADIDKIRIDLVQEVPFKYSPGKGVRVTVRAIGPVLSVLGSPIPEIYPAYVEE
jgi:hypothetical protein